VTSSSAPVLASVIAPTGNVRQHVSERISATNANARKFKSSNDKNSIRLIAGAAFIGNYTGFCTKNYTLHR
jgi:hypothetical protein